MRGSYEKVSKERSAPPVVNVKKDLKENESFCMKGECGAVSVRVLFFFLAQ